MKDPHLPDTPAYSNKIRVPGADEPKNALEVLKIQFENFRKWSFIGELKHFLDFLL